MVTSRAVTSSAAATLSSVVIATRAGACRLAHSLAAARVRPSGGATGGRRGRGLFSGGGIGIGVLLFCSAGPVGDVGYNVVAGRLHRNQTMSTDVTLLSKPNRNSKIIVVKNNYPLL